ncbi:MAG: TonB-dependent receptor plug domain-containing protein [Opitutaceae bacterium]|nr:TonB-dependent receptor plug domain-containing protein [Opitutaceae bacterium]
MKPSLHSSLLLSLFAGLSAVAQTAPAPSLAAEKTSADETVVLSPFQVKGARERGYAVPQAMGASRVALPVSDVPLSVIGLGEQHFSDKGAVSALEVLSLVSGITPTSSLSPLFESYTLRGFNVGAGNGFSIRDGLPDNVGTVVGSFDDSSAYERVEVIKGPAGTLYGTTSMGGVINKISKWPRFSPQTKVQLQVQSYDEFVRAMVDSTGPLGDRGAYRAVISSQEGERYWGAGRNDIFNTVLAYTHLLGDAKAGGRIWGRFQYLSYDIAITNGTVFPTGWKNPLDPNFAPFLTNPKFAVPKEIMNAPSDDNSPGDVRAYEAGFEYSWAQNQDNKWTLRLVARHNEAIGDQGPSYSLTLPVPVDSNGAIVTYTNAAGAQVAGDARFISKDDPRVADWRTVIRLREFDGKFINSGLYLDIVGEFKTGPLKHILVTNGQLTSGQRERAFFFWDIPNPANTTAVANSFSAIRPNFSNYDRKALEATTPQFNPFNGLATNNAFAFGFQDNITFLQDKVILVGGARYDKVTTTTEAFASAPSIAARRFVIDPASTRKIVNQQWTSKVGLVVKPMPGVSVFGQIGETYIPINTLSPTTGLKYPNQLGSTDEVGVKLDLLGSKLIATASVFKMELTNVLIQVNNPPELGGGFILVPAGTQTADGYEFDIAWEPMSGLYLMLGYSDIDSKNETGLVFGMIEPAWSLNAKYAFLDGSLKGAYFGGNWRRKGATPGSGNAFFLPDADVFDAFIGYGRDRWNVQLNVMNVTNTDDILIPGSDSLLYRAHDRTYRLTVNYTF